MPYTTSCNTQSSAPEDGQNNCPKYIELIGIINKLLLLHLVGGIYYLYYVSIRTDKLRKSKKAFCKYVNRVTSKYNILYYNTLSILANRVL